MLTSLVAALFIGRFAEPSIHFTFGVKAIKYNYWKWRSLSLQVTFDAWDEHGASHLTLVISPVGGQSTHDFLCGASLDR